MRSACGKPDALALVASKAGFGSFDELGTFYACLPADYDDKLPADEIATARCHQKNTTMVHAARRAGDSSRVVPAKPPLFWFLKAGDEMSHHQSPALGRPHCA